MGSATLQTARKLIKCRTAPVLFFLSVGIKLNIMSLYNMMNGVNQLTFFVLPMLGKHPNEYPRFRDFFLQDEEHPEYDNYLHVYTRCGGGNRGCDFGEEELMKHPNFVATFDDSYDCTYGTYVFSVPTEWKDDFEKIITGKLLDISDEYKVQIYKVFPKLEEKLKEMFKKAGEEKNKTTTTAD
jgi:hypothetical protein